MISTNIDITRNREAGFTLVELAVVMIIIGLLIGGVLKGQELITNAEVANTNQTAQTADSAVLGFYDAYDALPGDTQNATARIPNCAAAPCAPASGTQGNRIVEGGTAATAIADDTESHAFFIQMTEADFISGIEGDAAAANEDNYPSVPVGQSGVIQVTYFDGTTAFPSAVAAAPASARRGHYFVLHGAPGNAIDPGFVEQAIAARIDRKLDDGTANSGDVIAAETGVGVCADGAGVYQEADRTNDCALYIGTSF